MAWVVQLASGLKTNGVDVILDRWRLREGQDAHAFMETMVSDSSIRKVVVICDKTYAEKSVGRMGGVGTESSIMSSEIYGRSDQTKFVAICREKDEFGKAYLPVFFQSRLYIDLSEQADYAAGFEQLLRWCHDEPLYLEPEIGRKPTFSVDASIESQKSARDFTRVSTTVAADPRVVVRSAVSYIRSLAATHSNLVTIEDSSSAPLEDLIFDKIESFSGTFSVIRGVLEDTLSLDVDDQLPAAVHEYLETLISFFDTGPTTWAADATKFFAHFVFLQTVSSLVRVRKLKSLGRFLDEPFLKRRPNSYAAKSVTYEHLRIHIESLDARSQKTGQRRLSPQADLIKNICERMGQSFGEIIEADFLVFLRDAFDSNPDRIYYHWYPITLLYIGESDGALPLFVRAQQQALKEELISVLGIASDNQVIDFRSRLKSGAVKVDFGGFQRPNIARLSNLDLLFPVVNP